MVEHELNTTDHRFYDKIFTDSRRMLWNDPEWRQGPERAYDVATQAIKAFRQYSLDFNKSYLEIGCGPYSPLGVSTVMYLNGVKNTIAFDTKEADHKRAAEALYDLLAACALEPDRWNLFDKDYDKFFDRLYSFNTSALKRGDLPGGVAGTDLGYVIGNLESIPLADESISIASSRATLEHIPDFRKGMQELYRIMKPGGISFHSIDLADHRIYRSPDKYNKWSFLTEDGDWSDGLCNRLRINEISNIAQKVGFALDVIETECDEIPKDTFKNFNSTYKAMRLEDLMVTSFTCVFRKI